MNNLILHIWELSDSMYSYKNGWWVTKTNFGYNEHDNEISLADFFEDIYNPTETEIQLFKLKTGLTFETSPVSKY